MRASECIHCSQFPCGDVSHTGYRVPEVEVDPQTVRVMLISEASPANPADDYFAPGSPLFAQTTIMCFKDANIPVESMQDILDLGVYITTAVKCGKVGYAISSDTIQQCSQLLEQEINLFPNVKAYLLMGDVAIKAVNAIAKRAGQPRVIPAIPTYKIRSGQFFFRGVRAFPSYTQAGKNILIEKGKRIPIAEDIAAALALAG